MNSNTLFWIVNAAGWFTYLLFAALFFGYFTGNLNPTSLLINLLAFCYFVPATGWLRWFIKRLGWLEHKQWGKLVPVLIMTNYLIALLGQFLISLFMMYGMGMMTWAEYSVPVLMVTSGQQWFVLCLWVSLYLAIKQMRDNRQFILKQAQLEATLHATELKALKAQLNPHFIFNCLNNMRAMAIDDGVKTREMITNLSEILKYSFQFGDHNQVTVMREIQHVKNYLALESIQFEDRLSYDFKVDAAVEPFMIPTLSIQLLVENAIKHGIMGLPDGGHIQINITQVNLILTITVINTGQIKDQPPDTTGVGLTNLRQRLALIYGDQATLNIQNIGHDQVAVQVNIPVEQQHD